MKKNAGNTVGKSGEGLDETILGWFRREEPENLWAVRRMPPTLTFRDLEKSMADGEGEGIAGDCADTVTRERMNRHLAKLVGKSYSRLIEWANARIKAKHEV